MKAVARQLTDEQIVSAVIEAEVQLAIGLGYSDKMIQKRVAKVTNYEIYKISRRIGLRRRDYRNCESPLGQFIWDRATAVLHRDPKTIQKTVPKLLKGHWP
jgi:hypothetical protein